MVQFVHLGDRNPTVYVLLQFPDDDSKRAFTRLFIDYVTTELQFEVVGRVLEPGKDIMGEIAVGNLKIHLVTEKHPGQLSGRSYSRAWCDEGTSVEFAIAGEARVREPGNVPIWFEAYLAWYQR